MAVATNAQLARTPNVGVESRQHRQVDHETAYFRLVADWRGEQYEVDMIAERYVASDSTRGDVWTGWNRPYALSVHKANGEWPNNGATDAARARIAEVCRPLVVAWLEGPDYPQARQQAYASLIARELRDERYSTDRPVALFAKYAHELDDTDRVRLSDAIDALAHFLKLVELR